MLLKLSVLAKFHISSQFKKKYVCLIVRNGSYSKRTPLSETLDHDIIVWTKPIHISTTITNKRQDSKRNELSVSLGVASAEIGHGILELEPFIMHIHDLIGHSKSISIRVTENGVELGLIALDISTQYGAMGYGYSSKILDKRELPSSRFLDHSVYPRVECLPRQCIDAHRSVAVINSNTSKIKMHLQLLQKLWYQDGRKDELFDFPEAKTSYPGVISSISPNKAIFENLHKLNGDMNRKERLEYLYNQSKKITQGFYQQCVERDERCVLPLSQDLSQRFRTVSRNESKRRSSVSAANQKQTLTLQSRRKSSIAAFQEEVEEPKSNDDNEIQPTVEQSPIVETQSVEKLKQESVKIQPTVEQSPIVKTQSVEKLKQESVKIQPTVEQSPIVKACLNGKLAHVDSDNKSVEKKSQDSIPLGGISGSWCMQDDGKFNEKSYIRRSINGFHRQSALSTNPPDYSRNDPDKHLHFFHSEKTETPSQQNLAPRKTETRRRARKSTRRKMKMLIAPLRSL
eukprot:TRINITY_DN680_c0_g1_i1.p1 TRINITY_DN680_c0_g1~~TRINITY_DN680_c0_g1_i1.p1  ORF type:complete len:514 (+),score=57.38 TRINITY_DN680_c0_g1_i1:80-1621(+)